MVHSITNDEDGNYRMLVLTQTADYIELAEGSLMTAPDAVTVSDVSIEQKTTSCFLSTSFVCGQLFAVTIPKPSDLDCADSSSSTVFAAVHWIILPVFCLLSLIRWTDTGRSTINVHVEVLVTLSSGSGTRRRRMLLQNVGSNQIRHFIGSADLLQSEEMEEDDATVMNVTVVAIGSAAVVGVLVFVVMLLRMKKKTGKREETEMAVHVAARSPSSAVSQTMTGVHVEGQNGGR